MLQNEYGDAVMPQEVARDAVTCAGWTRTHGIGGTLAGNLLRCGTGIR